MNIKHTLTWALLATLLSASTPADIKFTPAETQQISISTPGLFDKSKAFSIDFTSMGDRAYSFPLPVGKATLSDKEDRLEITSKKGDAVKAMFDGCVRLARKMDRHGNVIVIRHDNGLETVYENNAQNLVQSGQTVKAGQTIAIIGNDGEQGLCRFFIMVNGSRVNPTTIVNARNHRLYRQVLAFEKRGANIRIIHIDGESNEKRGLTLDPDEETHPFENSSSFELDLTQIGGALGLPAPGCQGHQPLWRQTTPQWRRPQDQAQRQHRGCFRRRRHPLSPLLGLRQLHHHPPRLRF